MPEKELERILVELAGAGQTITPEQLQSMIDSVGNGINYVTKQVVTENGNVATIYQLVNPATLVTSSLALITMEVPTAMAFIGPALGIAVGAGILSRTEPFQNVGNLIGEKIYAFLNSDGQILFPEETIQAYAEKFDEIGITNRSALSGQLYDIFAEAGAPTTVNYTDLVMIKGGRYIGEIIDRNRAKFSATYTAPKIIKIAQWSYEEPARIYCRYIITSLEPFVAHLNEVAQLLSGGDPQEYHDTIIVSEPSTFEIASTGEIYTWYLGYITTSSEQFDMETAYFELSSAPSCFQSDYPDYNPSKLSNMSWEFVVSFVANFGTATVQLQPGAVIPSTIPLDIPTTYPSWTPSTAPGVVPAPNIYPIEIPAAQPAPEVEPTPQPQIQSPSPITNPETDPRSAPTTEIITQTQPQVYPNPVPQPSPDPDPAPSVDPDPSLDPSQPVEPNPPSANTDPDPTTPTIVDPSLVSGSAGKLFTVYNPSSTGLNDLGAYLWSTNIIDIVKSIWQNPMDGIISYFVLYATPEANRTSTIYLGALDSGVSSPVVTNQFIDIDCGEVQIKEKWNNIGDYPPYTSIKLFLPFVGFVDINPDDVMGRDDGGGYIKVTYRVDVYTGTCLAQVWVRRAADMANYQILYTYNGNCAQQIPLTGATYQGLMQTLVGASVGFASAGLTGALASAATQFAGHQQVQMQRSGNMSANAGVLGQRKPYLIISRNNVYYATNFAEYYGYPAHATVVLGNMSGYVRVRDIHLEVPATSEELDEIEALLKEGVWF